MIYKSFISHISFLFLYYLLFYSSENFVSGRKWQDIPKKGEYEIVIDAGSSGSRIYVWTIKYSPTKNSKPFFGPAIEDYSKKITPGVSNILLEEDYQKSIEESIPKIQEYLTPLIEFGKNAIPPEHYNQTLFHIRATAGLRVLPPKKSHFILEIIKKSLEKENFPFPFKLGDIKIVDGIEEGVWGWLSAWLLTDHEKVGTLDLGGGSTQIAFPTKENRPYQNSTHYAYLNGITPNPVFTWSWLRFGKNEARFRLTELLYETNSGLENVINPCLSLDYSRSAHEDLPLFTEIPNFKIKGSSNPQHCFEIIKTLLNLTDCQFPISSNARTCFMNGISSPNDYVPNQITWYARDYYVKILRDFYKLPEQVSLSEIKKTVENLCSLDFKSYKKLYGKDPENFCFEGVWIYNLLLNGYHFDDKTEIHFVESINNVEITWAFGCVIQEHYLYYSISDIAVLNKWLNPSYVFFGFTFLGLCCFIDGCRNDTGRKRKRD